MSGAGVYPSGHLASRTFMSDKNNASLKSPNTNRGQVAVEPRPHMIPFCCFPAILLFTECCLWCMYHVLQRLLGLQGYINTAIALWSGVSMALKLVRLTERESGRGDIWIFANVVNKEYVNTSVDECLWYVKESICRSGGREGKACFLLQIWHELHFPFAAAFFCSCNYMLLCVWHLLLCLYELVQFIRSTERTIVCSCVLHTRLLRLRVCVHLPLPCIIYPLKCARPLT